MPIEAFGLEQPPFTESGRPLVYVNYAAQQDALHKLERLGIDDRGAALLHGPAGSGKTTLARHFAEIAGKTTPVAFLSGDGFYASQLLTRVLSQYGYNVTLNSTGELLGMLEMFLQQQTRTNQAPLLIIDNLQRMLPGALSVLCKLAQIRSGEQFALRLLLVGRTDGLHLLRASSMGAVSSRLSPPIELQPMQAREAISYLYSKLRAAGANQPDDIFPVNTCDHLHQMSKGLPGKLDAIAGGILDKATELPIELDNSADVPRFIVSRDGEVIQDVEALETRLLIGRSELSDMFLTDQFISKQHALLIWNDDTVVLVDLNSSNGTYVNSRRVRTQVLRHNDVISVGDHRIKMIYEKAGSRDGSENSAMEDTIRMKTLADSRRSRALRRRPLRLVQ